MKLWFVGIGLCLVGSGTVLSGLGHYDGVLGATAPQDLLAPEATHQVLVRVEVAGTPAQAADQLAELQRQLVLPGPLLLQMQTGPYVSVRFSEEPSQTAFMRYGGAAPVPGQILVVQGEAHAYWPLRPDSPAGFQAVPVVFLDAQDYREPLFFRD